MRAITRLAAMARRPRISLLSCVFALALAGCGSSDDGTIPPDDASELLSLLAAVEQEANSGSCEIAQGLAQEFVTSVNDLPNDVDPKVAGELTKAATNLEGLTEQPGECPETGATGEFGDQSTTSTTSTVTTEPTTTEETTTDDEPTTTEEPTEEQPSEDPNPEPPAGGGPSGETGGGTGGGGTGSPSGGVGAGGGAG